jgi:hypothetical protein
MACLMILIIPFMIAAGCRVLKAFDSVYSKAISRILVIRRGNRFSGGRAAGGGQNLHMKKQFFGLVGGGGANQSQKYFLTHFTI